MDEGRFCFLCCVCEFCYWWQIYIYYLLQTMYNKSEIILFIIYMMMSATQTI